MKRRTFGAALSVKIFAFEEISSNKQQFHDYLIRRCLRPSDVMEMQELTPPAGEQNAICGGQAASRSNCHRSLHSPKRSIANEMYDPANPWQYRIQPMLSAGTRSLLESDSATLGGFVRIWAFAQRAVARGGRCRRSGRPFSPGALRVALCDCAISSGVNEIHPSGQTPHHFTNRNFEYRVALAAGCFRWASLMAPVDVSRRENGVVQHHYRYSGATAAMAVDADIVASAAVLPEYHSPATPAKLPSELPQPYGSSCGRDIFFYPQPHWPIFPIPGRSFRRARITDIPVAHGPRASGVTGNRLILAPLVQSIVDSSSGPLVWLRSRRRPTKDYLIRDIE